MEQINKILVGLTEDGELDVIQTDIPEEGMFKVSEEELKQKING